MPVKIDAYGSLWGYREAVAHDRLVLSGRSLCSIEEYVETLRSYHKSSPKEPREDKVKKELWESVRREIEVFSLVEVRDTIGVEKGDLLTGFGKNALRLYRTIPENAQKDNSFSCMTAEPNFINATNCRKSETALHFLADKNGEIVAIQKLNGYGEPTVLGLYQTAEHNVFEGFILGIKKRELATKLSAAPSTTIDIASLSKYGGLGYIRPTSFVLSEGDYGFLSSQRSGIFTLNEIRERTGRLPKGDIKPRHIEDILEVLEKQATDEIAG